MRSKAAGAQFHALRAAVHDNRRRLDIGAPVSPGPPLRMADVVAGLPGLEARFTSGHSPPLTLNNPIK